MLRRMLVAGQALVLVGGLVGWLTLAPVAAATATTTTDLNLRGGPSLADGVLTVMSQGSSLSVDGAAEAGFYPVTYNGQPGWAFGAYLSISGEAAAPASGNAVTSTDLKLRSGPSLADGVLLVMPPGTGVTLTGQSANGFSSVTYNGVAGWAFAAYLTTSGAAPIPSPAPGASPTPPAGTGPTGSATATTDVNLRSGPDVTAPVLFLVPGGSTVTVIGSISNGYSAASYQGIAGWVATEYLTEVVAPAPEPNPPTAPGPVKTPEAGTGTAYTTTELNLRDGPSANQPVLAVMPAGAAVSLTGVTEAGFYRVIYNGQVGWAAVDYLSVPGAPPTSTGGVSYTQDQIVQIIYEAADRYSQSREDMLRVAQCESNLDPNAVNPSGSYGLFQFIRSTWAGTPYASYDIFDPWANANAAGWMWSVGRANEFICG